MNWNPLKWRKGAGAKPAASSSPGKPPAGATAAGKPAPAAGRKTGDAAIPVEAAGDAVDDEAFEALFANTAETAPDAKPPGKSASRAVKPKRISAKGIVSSIDQYRRHGSETLKILASANGDPAKTTKRIQTYCGDKHNRLDVAGKVVVARGITEILKKGLPDEKAGEQIAEFLNGQTLIPIDEAIRAAAFAFACYEWDGPAAAAVFAKLDPNDPAGGAAATAEAANGGESGTVGAGVAGNDDSSDDLELAPD